MKILYLGCFRDSTGWSQAAQDYILALDAAGADVTCRPIKLNSVQPAIPERIQELEAKPYTGTYDAVLQHALPTMFDYNGKIPLNVGMYATETDRVIPSWVRKINTMDRAVVFNQQSREASITSGVTIPIAVVPHATDMARFQKKYPSLPLRDEHKDDFIFYFVGEYNTRKDIRTLLQAFHLAFAPDEMVQLVLKLTCPIPLTDNLEAMRFRAEVTNYCRKIKEMMRIYDSPDKYKQEILITNNLTATEVMRLHSSCDCFVCPSHGEAWCIPAFDAMAMGKTPIVPEHGGFAEYVTGHTGYPLSYVETPVYGMERNVLPGMFTSRENWIQVDVLDLVDRMRLAYDDQKGRKIKAANGIKAAYEFSHEKVGKRLLEELGNNA